MTEQQKLTENLEKEAVRIEKAEQLREEIQATEEEGYDGFSDSKVKLIPNPNFTECKSVGTMLPINMANETVTNLSLLAQNWSHSKYDCFVFWFQIVGDAYLGTSNVR